jgi:hypothetical protein
LIISVFISNLNAKVKKAFISIFTVLSSAAHLYAAKEPLLIYKDKVTVFGNGISYFIDSSAHLTIADILKVNPSRFQMPAKQTLTYPLSAHACWIKFHAVNLTKEKVYLKIDNPTMDTVAIFYYDPQKSAFIPKIYGYNLPVEDRAVSCPDIIFELPYCGEEGSDYYLRIISRKVLYLPLSAGNLDVLLDSVLLTYILDIVYFGLILGMIIFNLFIAFSLRSRTYFLYVALTFFLSLYIFHYKGYPIFLNFSLKIFLGTYSNSVAALALVLSIFFAIYFLKVREFSKVLYIYCLFMVFMNLPIIYFEFIGDKVTGIKMQIPAIYLTSLSLVIIAAYIYFKGLKHARFYLLANSLFQISITAFIIPRYAQIPWPEYHSHILPIGHALEITILAIALVDRVGQLRKEKEKILKESLEQEKELNEELQTREEDLAASENELKNTNHQLHFLNKDLIDKNGQMIDNQIKLFASLEDARVLNNKLSLRDEELTSKEEELRLSLDELNLAYKQLKESERMLTLAQKIAKTGSWKFSLETGKTEMKFSEPLYDIFEIPYDTELTHELLTKILGKEIIEMNARKIEESVKTKTPFSIKYQFQLKNGEIKHLHSIGTPYLDDKENVKEVYGITQDITEIQKAEDLFTKQTIELIESNNKAAEFKLLALRSVMNPHFLFNSLNSIQYFITKNDREQALTYLAIFSKLIRSILCSSMANYNSLLEELEILRLYVNLESLRFKNKFKSEFKVDPALNYEEILIPSLLLQPYIENAIIHGLFHKEGNDGLLRVSFGKMNDKVLCIVEDNGIGRAMAMEIKKANNLHKSIGMLVTKERIDLINNDDQVSVIITDLFDSENQPKGTKVEVLVAFK